MGLKKLTMRNVILVILLSIILFSNAQENINYQKPPKEILELVDIQRAPSVLIDERSEYMILISKASYKSIEELSQEELRLGGLRINPKTNIGSRVTFFNKIQIKNIKIEGSKVVEVRNMPSGPKLNNFSWSPDQKKMAFTNTTPKGVELWFINIETATATKISDANLNANLRDVINWFSDSKTLLVKIVSSERKPLINKKDAIPTGPIISVNKGKKAQNRTYQDLLQNKNDEHNFEQLALSEIYKISLDGKKEKWLGSAMYKSITFSPDGEYVMVSTIEKPFSYLVPYYRFPSKTVIYTKEAKKIKTIVEVPLIEDLPKGFMACTKGRRRLTWRNDMPSTIIFAQALDGGDPKKEVDFRDEIFELKAPFNGKPNSLLKTINRFSIIEWGDKNTAIAYDYWWNTRNVKTYLFNPSKFSEKVKIINDRNYQDKFSNPGRFVSKMNRFGKSVLDLENGNLFLIGEGYTPKGQFPFIDKLNLKSNKTERVYLSTYTDKLERIRKYNSKENKILVRIESSNKYPNYYIKDLKSKELTQLTNFENPFRSIQNAYKKVIKYKREDGLELSATLYLPLGYDTLKKEKMPMIIWAYPKEFKDKSSAGQSTQNANKFTYPYYGSMIYWITRGYVVLDDASFPIVGEGKDEPNDTFREQLVANAKAAIDAVDELGYIDRKRVAIAGHSYGAFMVANLLTHSNLFAAGIARSGAYNRSLTPFGFQSEERNYWEAPEIYNAMSPFMHAEKMKYPLLLIHGEEDNNPGTYPMQSKRYFNALKGLGANVRLVLLPKESHGYRAKESILHLLWEQDQWLEQYVKNRVD